jgi:hypothetical protein
MACDVDSNIKSRKMPLIQADPYNDNRNGFSEKENLQDWGCLS